MIGLLSAMEEEVQLFRTHLDLHQTAVVGGVSYRSGAIEGVEVVLAQCGVGKVNGAAATQAMIDRFPLRAVIFTGLAGGLVSYLHGGDVVIANFVGQHDFDLTAFGKRPGQVSDSGRLIEADPKLVKLAVESYERAQLPEREGRQMVVGTIVTGDSFIADDKRLRWLQREFGAVAAEMEGAAVGQVCHNNGVPFAVIRVISDSASGGAAGEFIMFLDEASEVSYRIVSTMLPKIGQPRPVAV